jgi:hypothetical protein
MHKYSYTKEGGNEGRSNAWRGIDVEAMAYDSRMGSYFRWSPFQHGWTNLTADGSNGVATLVEATTGAAIVNASVEGGWVQVDSESSTDNQGAALFFPGTIVMPAADRTIVLKGILRARDIATAGMQGFFGLVLSSVATAPVTADAPAAGATDYIGVYTTGNTGTLNKMYFAAEDGGTQSLSTVAFHTLVDGDVTTDGSEIFKVEIRVNGTQSLELWIDGVKMEHDVAASAIPEDTALRLAISCVASATVDPILEFKELELASVPGVWGP